MRAPPASALSIARLRDGLLVAEATFVVSLLLAQSTSNQDGANFLVMAASGRIAESHHLLYVPLLLAARDLCGALVGATLYEAALLLSAAGTAAGVFFVHAGLCRLRMPRAQSLLAATLVAGSPAVLFFATMVESHGACFAFAGLAFAATAELVARPVPGRSVALGLATGLAYAVHASGMMLPALLLPTAVALGRQRSVPWRLLFGLAAVAGVTHVAAILAVPLLAEQLGSGLSTSGQIDYMLVWVREYVRHPELLPGMLVSQWLLPYAPLSVAWIPALLRPGDRLLATLFGGVLSCYLAVTFLLGGPVSQHQPGAYMLPLAPVMAWLAVRTFDRRWTLGLIACGFALSVYGIRAHDVPERSARYVEGVRAIAGDHPALLVIGQWQEVDALFRELPGEPFLLLSELEVDPRDAATAATLLESYVGLLLDQGLQVLVSEGARTGLEKFGVFPEARRMLSLLDGLEARFGRRVVAASGFRGMRLSPPP